MVVGEEDQGLGIKEVYGWETLTANIDQGWDLYIRLRSTKSLSIIVRSNFSNPHNTPMQYPLHLEILDAICERVLRSGLSQLMDRKQKEAKCCSEINIKI
jgi:hypothetical protein